LYYILIIFNKKIYYVGNDKLYQYCFGFLRLRIDPTPGGLFVNEIKDCGLIRELHVYSNLSNVGDNIEGSLQHKGFGRQLVAKAEELAITNGYQRIAIISGTGVREYYKKLGYSLIDTYMIKNI
jgi:elongator complex protein 3